ncbi:MAG: magnesium transporter [Xanthobacteraceae bacterium]|nr:magnesium transporter [Xanthobacteraceae bacterium]
MSEGIVHPDTPKAAPRPRFRNAQGAVAPRFIAVVSAVIVENDAERLRALAGKLHESDMGELITALEPDERPRLVDLLGKDFDFTALTEVDDAVREEILADLPAPTVAEGVREIDSDDAVYILKDLPEAKQVEILGRLPVPARAALERSLRYPEESAGRRMQVEYVAVPPDWTVGNAIDHLRKNSDLPDSFYELFVVDAAYLLTGTVGLDRLLRSQRPVKIAEILKEDFHVIRATDDQEEAARLFERYNLVSAPVVDAAGHLLGVLTADDVIDVIEEEATEDIKALGGVASDEQISDSVWSIARGRFSWLAVNLVTAILASAVIGLFEGPLQKMVALAVLMPVVASQGGNATTQTMTVAVRALATRELGPNNAWRVIGRELMVGLLNGLAFAVIMGVVAVAWFRVPDLGIVIGLAMLINLIAAALGGILIPLTMRRLRVDPAVASSPFVTTVTDVVGFFAFLGLASWWFGLN